MKSTGRPCRLILIRHAESDRNKVKKGATYFADEEARSTLRGIPDYKIGLTDEGARQARMTGEYLRQHFGIPDYFYHSGYTRTIQTLEGILKSYPVDERSEIQVRMNHAIRERDAGYAYDMTKEEAEAHFPYLAEYWKTHGGFFARPPGGESLSDVVQRAYDFVGMIFRDRVDMDVWVVTH
ncbi:histidine phosphatase family protein, partial [Candidatus Parcubacteria bacterium]|nr:histidine phosphatase family protein [Candidatus Parcubacteria bacterium]